MVFSSVLTLLLVLAVAGVLLWALTQIQTIDPAIKQIMRVVVIVVVAIYVIYWIFALLGGVGVLTPSPMIPRLR